MCTRVTQDNASAARLRQTSHMRRTVLYTPLRISTDGPHVVQCWGHVCLIRTSTIVLLSSHTALWTSIIMQILQEDTEGWQRRARLRNISCLCVHLNRHQIASTPRQWSKDRRCLCESPSPWTEAVCICWLDAPSGELARWWEDGLGVLWRHNRAKKVPCYLHTILQVMHLV